MPPHCSYFLATPGLAVVVVLAREVVVVVLTLVVVVPRDEVVLDLEVALEDLLEEEDPLPLPPPGCWVPE